MQWGAQREKEEEEGKRTKKRGRKDKRRLASFRREAGRGQRLSERRSEGNETERHRQRQRQKT